MVTEFSGLDEMGNGEEGAKHDAYSTHDDVGDTEEGVLASHYGAARDDDGFRAAVFGNIKFLKGEVVSSIERSLVG